MDLYDWVIFGLGLVWYVAWELSQASNYNYEE